MKERIENLHNAIFSEKVRDKFETLTLYLAVIGFLTHLLLIALKDMDILPITTADGILNSPISAIYTPFSFILVYEVFLLLYHLHESFSSAVAKEFEIIALIVVRRLFKDISKLDNTEEWFTSKYNLQLGIDMAGFLLLFLLISFFYRLRRRSPDSPDSPNVRNFILMKKAISALLVPVLLGLVVYSLTTWGIEVYQYNRGILTELSDINYIFYDEFFTSLIIADVLILILSFHYTYHYSQLIRNTGFIVSTVLIRMSFTTTGFFNIILVVGGVIFGTLTLLIYNQITQTREKMEEEH